MSGMDNNLIGYVSSLVLVTVGLGLACARLARIARERDDLAARLEKSAAANEELKKLALYDWLTGLPNRLLLEDRINQAIAKAQREQGRFVVLFLDLDCFKMVNDKFGHATGDLLLNQIALRLSENLRHHDTVARMGGDEFVVVAEVTTSQDISAICDKVAKSFANPFLIAEKTLAIHASIGRAQYPEDGQSIEDLLSKADDGMYNLKNGKRLDANYIMG
ncbi:diguanylate cyclase (GGDEF)-like protein [Herbaspirillum sp. SJZ130]|nr:diguanylate cyclase (GGDEF)-like protein [Herbaspirillum sp. SJZ130]TQK15262.1 diguanylate cyclase (GGDEF)-like protein [Herbaspirillum sp. SJZ106]